MNTKDFLQLGVPLREATRRASNGNGVAAQRDLVAVLRQFDPRLVKMAPTGERPEA